MLDHERLGRLLRRMCSPGPSQDRWRAEFLGLLRAHRGAERTVVVGHVIDNVASLAPAAREQSHADDGLDRLDQRLRATDLGTADLATVATETEALLRHHADSWADRLMAPLEGTVARGVMRRLGGDYARRRDELLTSEGVIQTPPRRLDLSRAELYELARRAGIEGRSSMTRGQLIDELQRHDE